MPVDEGAVTTIRALRQWFLELLHNTSDPAENGVLLLEADILLGHVLGKSRAQLFTGNDTAVAPAHITLFKELAVLRRGQVPIAYLVGHKEFYSREFTVNPNVLIPRPETELVVEKTLEYLRVNAPCWVIDVGTGSGAIICSIAKELERIDSLLFSQCSFVAVDLSFPALEVARQNIAAHGLSMKIDMLQADLLTALELEDERPIVIASNPPYVCEGENLPRDVGEYEPSLALYGGIDGLSVIRRMLPQSAELLKNKSGIVVFEIGQGQHVEVECLARAEGFRDIDFSHDLQGITRVAELRVT